MKASSLETKSSYWSAPSTADHLKTGLIAVLAFNLGSESFGAGGGVGVGVGLGVGVGVGVGVGASSSSVVKTPTSLQELQFSPMTVLTLQ